MAVQNVSEHHHVIGGGFSGLMTAYFLRKKGHQVVLFEPGPLGGMIQTQSTPEGLVESAANGFLLSPLMLEVISDLGLKLARPQKKSRARYFSSESLRRWPLGPVQTLRALFGFMGARMVKEHLPTVSESLTAWGERVFGRPFAEKILNIAVQGIYGASGDQLSGQLLISGFIKPKTKETIDKNAPRGLASFPGGMGELTQALAEHLGQDKGFHLRTESVSAEEIRSWSEDPAVHNIWIATSIRQAASLCARVAPELSNALKSIPTVPLVTGSFFFERSLKDKVGFGCLRDPRFEKPGEAVLGVLFNDHIFEGRSPLRSETWILGGLSNFPSPLLKKNHEQILSFVLEKRSEIFGLTGACVKHHIRVWPEALPLYGFALAEKQRLFQQPWGKMLLIGNYVNGIGLTKIAADIHSRVDNLDRPLKQVQD